MARAKTTTEADRWLIWSLLQVKDSTKMQHRIAQELLREGVGICFKNDGKSSDDRMAQIERLRCTTYRTGPGRTPAVTSTVTAIINQTL